eukprot:8288-Heterococcus_DN1.PRE.4
MYTCALYACPRNKQHGMRCTGAVTVFHQIVDKMMYDSTLGCLPIASKSTSGPIVDDFETALSVTVRITTVEHNNREHKGQHLLLIHSNDKSPILT